MSYLPFPRYKRSSGVSGNFVKIIDEMTITQPDITGDTNNNIAYSVLIPANTFGVGKEIMWFSRFVSDTILAQKHFRQYINTANNLTGANLIGNFTAGNAIRSADFSRVFDIKSATVTEVYGVTNSNPAFTFSSTIAVTQHNIDWTIDQYFILAIQLTNPGDICKVSSNKIIS